MIAVTFALPQESSQFLRHLRDKCPADRNGIRIIHGKIDDRAVEVLHTGVGEKLCRERVGKFLNGRQFDVLISSGFAGALDDHLQPGDLLMAENFSTIDPRKKHSSVSELEIRTGNLLTVPALIHSSEQRTELAYTSGAAAVDMETEFIARACAEHGIPLVSLRVITDTPQHLLPAPPHMLFDIAKQKTDLVKLGKFFAMRPHRTPQLVQFARKIGKARKVLANALTSIVQNL